MLIDFPDLFGQERVVRQDTRMPAQSGGFVVEPGSPATHSGAAAGIGLIARGLSHSYGELRVLAGLDLEVPPHGVIGLVGPSGCGKSTLLELIAGLQDPGSGGLEAGGGTSAAERLASCAYMPQRDLLFPWLSAIDNAA